MRAMMCNDIMYTYTSPNNVAVESVKISCTGLLDGSMIRQPGNLRDLDRQHWNFDYREAVEFTAIYFDRPSSQERAWWTAATQSAS